MVLQSKTNPLIPQANYLLYPEKFPHNMLLLFFFFSFRDEKQLLSGCSPLYQKKLQEQGFQDVVNRNKIIERYGDLADPPFSQFNENSINYQDPNSQSEYDETPREEYSNEKA